MLSGDQVKTHKTITGSKVNELNQIKAGSAITVVFYTNYHTCMYNPPFIVLCQYKFV